MQHLAAPDHRNGKVRGLRARRGGGGARVMSISATAAAKNPAPHRRESIFDAHALTPIALASNVVHDMHSLA